MPVVLKSDDPRPESLQICFGLHLYSTEVKKKQEDVNEVFTWLFVV